MTQAQSIAAKLDEEWKQNDAWLCLLLTKVGTGLLVQNMLERRQWLCEARAVAKAEVRKELGL